MQRQYNTIIAPGLLFGLLCATSMAFARGDDDLPGVSRMFSEVMPLKIGAHEQLKAAAAQSKSNAAKIKSYFADANNQELGCGDDGLIVGTPFPCKNMNLTAFLTGEELGSPYAENTATSLNDVWGWTDSTTGKEYALVGLFDGTSIVDISNPTQPATVAFLETTNGVVEGIQGNRNIWRDMKVIGNVLYVGSEVGFHGIQTFDLTLLRSPIVASPTTSSPGFFQSIWDFFRSVWDFFIHILLFPLRVFEFLFGSGSSDPDPVSKVPIVAPTFVTREVGSSHNIVAAPEAGKIIAVGLSSDDKTCPGATLAIFDISDNPVRPKFDACVSVDVASGYVHDAQCIKYDGPSPNFGGVNICALFMESAIALYDLDDRSVINSFTYNNAAYVHQGWFSEDHETLYVDDELDEVDGTSGTLFSTCYIFNMADLTAEIQPPMQFVTPSDHPSVDHNMYTKDGHVYQAAYTSGARVRKILDDTTLEEVAYFDSDLVCECVAEGLACGCDFFGGVWTFFPYFDSGLAVASSKADGLYILRPLLPA